MLPDKLDNPLQCPDCEPLREEWERCPMHEKMVEDRENEQRSVDCLFQDVIESFESLDNACDDITSDLTDGFPGVPFRTFHKNVKKYQQQKLDLMARLAAVDQVIDALALKHAGKTK